MSQTSDEFLLAEEILQMINEDNDECEESVEQNVTKSSIESNKPNIKLIDENEDLFGSQIQTNNHKNEANVKSVNNSSEITELFGELSDEEFESNDYLTKEGKLIQQNLSNDNSLFGNNLNNKSKKNNFWTQKSSSNSTNDDSVKEIYSGIRLKNPLISSFEMKERMEGRKMIKLSLIKSQINKSNDIEGDWVTIGIIVAKVGTKVSKNGKQYAIWKLSDLKTNKIVTFFLFGEVYAQHWKLPVSTVIGLLNPKIMSDSKYDSKYSKEEICSLTIEHSDKLLEIGTAKDQGYCRAVKKNQEICGALVNLSDGEYCIYHIKNAYKKFSSKRAEIQTSFSNSEPKKHLNDNKGFFANSYTDSIDSHKLETKLLNKNKLIEKKDSEKESLSKVVKNPISISARNLAATVSESNNSKSNSVKKVISAKDLFKINKSQGNRFGSDQHISVPMLAKGYKSGQMIDLNSNSKMSSKLRAIQLLKSKPITIEDPNQVKKDFKKRSLEKIKQKIDAEFESSNDKRKSDEMSTEEKKKKKMKSDLIEKALNRKSINDNEVSIAEANAQNKYFTHLENKEKLENKLLETTEIESDVVSCHNCKYTAHSSTELCKKNFHKLVKHKAIKRFFKCKNCKHRSYTFNTLMPVKACAKCGQNCYEKASITYVKEETTLSDEKLLIRGEEHKFLNSLR